MTSLLDAWARLERENPTALGVYRLRIFGESGLDLFAVIQLPDRNVGIQIEVPVKDVRPLPAYPSASGFRTRPERSGATTRITVQLEMPAFRAVFGEMCSDVIRACRQHGDDQARAVSTFVDRLGAWKELFDGRGVSPLREQEQVGLFGELLFLESLLEASIAPLAAVQSWRGPFGDAQDFRFGKVHVEVKSTMSSNDSINVTSLRQLDHGGLDRLFLWHFKLHFEQRGGRTLRTVVEVLRNWLDDGGRAAFDERLLKAGYLDLHAAEHYDADYLALLRTRAMKVESGFPALTRATVPKQVRDASYEVLLDEVPASCDLPTAKAMLEIRDALAGVSGT